VVVSFIGGGNRKKNTDLPHVTDKLIIIKAMSKPQCYLGHDPNKALLVPDSLRATERIGNRINACVTTGTIGSQFILFVRAFASFSCLFRSESKLI
jgi:hypothetical protein